MILIPEEYVDAMQLNEKVTDACEVKKDQKICNQFSYLDVKQQSAFATVEAELNQDQRKPIVIFNDTEVLGMLDFNGMAKMSQKQVISRCLLASMFAAENASLLIMLLAS